MQCHFHHPHLRKRGRSSQPLGRAGLTSPVGWVGYVRLRKSGLGRLLRSWMTTRRIPRDCWYRFLVPYGGCCCCCCCCSDLYFFVFVGAGMSRCGDRLLRFHPDCALVRCRWMIERKKRAGMISQPMSLLNWNKLLVGQLMTVVRGRSHTVIAYTLWNACRLSHQFWCMGLRSTAPSCVVAVSSR